MTEMTLNSPQVLTEVQEAFAGYERALMDNDVDALNTYFWNHPSVVRFGVVEELYGWEAVAAYRRAREPARPRTLLRTSIVAYGENTATAVTEYQEEGAAQVGRQSQTWVRFPEGWRIVSAHVSLPPLPGTTDQI